MSLIPFEQALAQLLSQIASPEHNETLNILHCANRICAEDIISPINVPSFNNSAMDGYAIRSQDFAEDRIFTIVGKSFAGMPFNEQIAEGECVRIMTGAMLPDGADVVIMQEEALLHSDNKVNFRSTAVNAGQNIRYVGEDIQRGDKVLIKGTPLNATTLPLLTSLGITEVAVFPKVKIAILSTGDELVSVGQPLQTGQIYDTNRFAVKLMLEKLPCEIIDFGILPDDPKVFEQVFTQAQQLADVIITSGGVSVGEADFTKDILEKLGTINFWKLAMKPGKPFAFGKLNASYFFGLPGNPVSALVTFYQLVQPALTKLSGYHAEQLAKLSQYLTAFTAKPLKKSVGRTDFQRGYYYANATGQLEVVPVGTQASHIFSAFHESNCFIVLEQERGNVDVGERVTIQPFNTLLT